MFELKAKGQIAIILISRETLQKVFLRFSFLKISLMCCFESSTSDFQW